MGQFVILWLVALLLPSPNFAQESTPTFRAEAESAFVWGKDAPHGAVSSIAHDPLTGRALHKLSYNGLEVSSRLGYEAQWLADSKWLAKPYDVIISVTTVTNNVNAPVSLVYGGASADGREISLIGDKSSKQLPHLGRKTWKELLCVQNGSVPSDIMILRNEQNRSQNNASVSVSRRWNVEPGTATTVSALTAIQQPNRTIEYRYFVRVNNKDFVFPWRMDEAQLCGMSALGDFPH